MMLAQLDSELLRFLASSAQQGAQTGDRLPALDELAPQLGISLSKLREQLEVARTLGLVTVRPKHGVQVAAYDFAPAVRISLLYSIARDPGQFEAFSQLRNHIEFSYFFEAVALLQPEDHVALREIIASAWGKLNGNPIRIPDTEHRALHLALFRRLGNPFVLGLLESYWDAYKAVGLNVFSDYDYLVDVWRHHEAIVEAVVKGDRDEAYRVLVQHTKLLQQREARRNGRMSAEPERKAPEIRINGSATALPNKKQDKRAGITSSRTAR